MGRDRERGSEAGSVLTAVSLMWAQTHELQDHDLSQSWTLNPLSHPGAPHPLLFKAAEWTEAKRGWEETRSHHDTAIKKIT